MPRTAAAITLSASVSSLCTRLAAPSRAWVPMAKASNDAAGGTCTCCPAPCGAGSPPPPPTLKGRGAASSARRCSCALHLAAPAALPRLCCCRALSKAWRVTSVYFLRARLQRLRSALVWSVLRSGRYGRPSKCTSCSAASSHLARITPRSFVHVDCAAASADRLRSSYMCASVRPPGGCTASITSALIIFN